MSYLDFIIKKEHKFSRNNGAQHDNFEALFDKIKTSDTKKQQKDVKTNTASEEFCLYTIDELSKF